MAGQIHVAVVSGQINSGVTGFTNFTKTNFGTPKACIIILSFDGADDANVAAEGRMSIGFSDFTDDRCVSFQDEDAQPKVDCDARKTNDKSYTLLGISGLANIQGAASTITDGVRLTNTLNDNADTPFVTIIMFGGADLNASVDSASVSSSQDTTASTTTGIDQNLVFFIGTDISGENNSSTGIDSGFGVASINDAHNVFVNKCISWASDHNSTVGSPSSVMRSNRCMKVLTEAGGDDWGIELTAADATSFTLTTRDNGAGAGMEVYTLSLDLDDRGFKIDGVDSPIGGATWTPPVMLGFTPQCVGLALTQATVEDTIETDADAGSIGISSNTGVGEETFHGWYNDDGGANSDTANNFRSRVIDLRNDDTTSVLQDHSHSSFNSDDWTYTINIENETIPRKWFYWAIEEASAPPLGLAPQPTDHLMMMHH